MASKGYVRDRYPTRQAKKCAYMYGLRLILYFSFNQRILIGKDVYNAI